MKALGFILESEEYQSFHVNNKNYVVSEEILFFEELGMWFDMSLSISLINQPSVFETDEELLSLNKRKRGKVNIFFSQEKDDTFFAEIFYTIKSRVYKYSERPSFGSSYIYVFSNEKGEVKLLQVEQIHYN
ncbi:hypothetical protein E0W72_10525 [Flavobacterium arcticum]|uniref:hypothetical protein n=1 Tax=Flavobacterium arcticum TaxID=1784713 RepID=UPI000FDEFA87|nr:hypothetical protein [Flavobacterium arcticum]KAF2508989.1 hypothetical protein E0W72_10525 [Flavobacterium arcticum]